MALSVYVHFPYCVHKCPYCDFNTYAVTNVPELRYRRALLQELDFRAGDPAWAQQTVNSVFFGGGTPSLMAPATVEAFLGRLAGHFPLSSDIEVTLEANPGSLEGSAAKRLADFRQAGVNRLSLGVQSLNARHLKTLGRIHAVDDSRHAFDFARRCGFDNISCDLIFAVPGQTVSDWRIDLAALSAWEPDHISAYNLTYEEGTPMTSLKNRGRIEPADEETELGMLAAARSVLTGAGYEHYEISNFARAGRRSRHNSAYWTWSNYMGLGAGAHGFSSGGQQGGQPGFGQRYANLRPPEQYMEGHNGGWTETQETLSREMAVDEFLMLGLRLQEGIAQQRFQDLFGQPVGEARPQVDDLCRQGWLENSGVRIRLSPTGMPIADAVIGRLLTG